MTTVLCRFSDLAMQRRLTRNALAFLSVVQREFMDVLDGVVESAYLVLTLDLGAWPSSCCRLGSSVCRFQGLQLRSGEFRIRL